jgi:hypothetical protein
MNAEMTQLSDAAQPKPSRCRKWLLKSLVAVVALAVCVPLLVRWYLLRTDYAPGFTKTEFAQVKPGDTLPVVLDRLKEPLLFAIISQRDDESRYRPQYSEDMSTLAEWAKDDSVLLILRYSKPRSPDGDYRAYEVWINKGTVQETRAYNWWD